MSSLTPLLFVDDLLRSRAQELDQQPVLAYPESDHGTTDFELFTPRDLDRLTNGAAHHLAKRGLPPVEQAPPPVIAMLGAADLNYIITMFALIRLGYTVLIFSPRLTVAGYVSLMKTTSSDTIVHTDAMASLVSKVQEERTISPFLMCLRRDYDQVGWGSLGFRLSKDGASKRVAYIMHSSGSSGLPKPIYQTHSACLGNYASGYGLRALTTVPLYHTHGHAGLYRTMFNHGTMYMYNANLPLTSSNITRILEEVKPKILFAVPYALKLVGESQQGIDALKSCDIVSSAGSALPNELGNRLTEQGIHIIVFLGTTETGGLMSSDRPKGDPSWDYMRTLAHVKPYMWMKPVDSIHYEMVILDGLKSKVISNSDDPPNSFHSKDLFIPHSTIPDAWKFVTRMDDRINLLNGEKVLPLPMEGLIRQDRLVREAAMFGHGKDLPGLLAFRSEHAAKLTDGQFVDAIWPAVQDANSRAEAFAQLSKDTIVVMSVDAECPQTDKGSLMRAKVYSQFADVIQDMYDRLDRQQEGSLHLNVNELRVILTKMFEEELQIHLDSPIADFFASGLDSLRAIQLASHIKKKLYLGGRGNLLDQNVIFDKANVSRLAEFLSALAKGEELNGNIDGHDKEIETMERLIEKYSTFETHQPSTETASRGETAIVTGATGSLGAFVLTRLIALSQFTKVYCFVRCSPSEDPQKRVLSALHKRSLSLPSDQLSKIHALATQMDKPDFNIPAPTLADLQSTVALIVHAAWAVNFNIGVRSFEADHIRGTHNLLSLALSVKRHDPAQFIFCSSIGVAGSWTSSHPIPETLISDLSLAQPTGYARSKLVTEHIVANAATFAPTLDAKVLRIGQIVGDKKSGIWNENEAIPLMIRTATTLKALPALDEPCSWLPVDSLASIILELAGLVNPPIATPPEGNQLVYNVLSPVSFSWTNTLLPALRRSGFEFSTVPTSEWLELLRRSSVDSEPAVKLLGFWEGKYGSEEGGSGGGSEVRKFDTTAAERGSVTLRNAPDVVRDGYVDAFVKYWLRRWDIARIND